MKKSPLRIGQILLRSPRKIDLFYGLGAVAIVLAMVALLLAGGPAAEEVADEGMHVASSQSAEPN